MNFCKYIIYAILSFFVLAVMPVQAQELRAPSTSKDLAFAFYKLAELTPDYNDWAIRSESYKKAPDFDKTIVRKSLQRQLEMEFEDYQPGEFLVIRSIVDFSKASDLQNTYFIEDTFNDRTFFRYDALGRNIALIVTKIEELQKIEMSEEEFLRAEDFIGSYDEAIVEILVRPQKVDAENPMIMNDQEYWLMLADIAEVRFYADTVEHGMVLFWYDKADWYTPEESLNKLYKK